jgi:hypothetical protein
MHAGAGAGQVMQRGCRAGCTPLSPPITGAAAVPALRYGPGTLQSPHHRRSPGRVTNGIATDGNVVVCGRAAAGLVDGAAAKGVAW